MPNIKIDSGTKRRMLCYTHTSHFVDDETLIDEKNRIFKKNKDLIDSITDKQLNAWIDILAKYANKWLNKNIPKLTKNFIDSSSLVVNTNDIFMDFIDENLKITNDDNDRISKNDMEKAFRSTYPNRHLVLRNIITALKEKEINYDGQLRCNKIRGCFIGVKFNCDDGIDCEIDDEMEALREENTRLKIEVEALKIALKRPLIINNNYGIWNLRRKDFDEETSSFISESEFLSYKNYINYMNKK